MGLSNLSNYPFACDPDVADGAVVAHHYCREDGFPDVVCARTAQFDWRGGGEVNGDDVGFISWGEVANFIG